MPVNALQSALIVDGMAFIVSLTKAANAKTFGRFSDFFNRRLDSYAYRETMWFLTDIALYLLRRVRERKDPKASLPCADITSRNVPTPTDWTSFLSLPESKADIARFISEQALM